MSPASARAQKAKTRLAGNVWAMRPVRVMCAWICFKSSMVVQDSVISKVGFVIITLVFEFHVCLSLEKDENRLKS